MVATLAGAETGEFLAMVATLGTLAGMPGRHPQERRYLERT
jgi:hypothetical protein